MQLHLEVRVRMVHHDQPVLDLDFNVEFFTHLACEGLLIGLSGLLLSTREFPQPPQQAFGFAFVNQHSTPPVDHAHGHVNPGPGLALDSLRQFHLYSLLIRLAQGFEGAQRTIGRLPPAQGGAELHHGLIEIPGTPHRHQIRGQGPQPLLHGRQSGITVQTEYSTEYAHHIAIHQRCPDPESNTGNGAGRIAPHT